MDGCFDLFSPLDTGCEISFPSVKPFQGLYTAGNGYRERAVNCRVVVNQNNLGVMGVFLVAFPFLTGVSLVHGGMHEHHVR